LTVLGLIGCAALVATAEWYRGTRRTVLVTVVGHLVTVGLGALVLLALRPTGWSWAVRLAGELGAGPIGGVLAAFTVAHGGVPGAVAAARAVGRERAGGGDVRAGRQPDRSAGNARGGDRLAAGSPADVRAGAGPERASDPPGVAAGGGGRAVSGP
jgi:hypothetical protein